MYDIDVNKTLVSKQETYGTNKSFKYFIGYNDDDLIRPLCMMLPQVIGYVKYFESNKAMFYTQIWKVNSNMEKKVKNLLSIKFDSEPVYGDNDKYIKTKIKIYDNNVNIIFHNKNVPKENV